MEAARNINQTKMDILGSLPPEIAQSISLYLTPENLDKACRCNKLWNNLLNRNYYWYKKCQARGYNELKHTSVSPIYEKYLARFPLYWQSFFNYNQLQYNWTNDIFESTSVAGISLFKLNYFDDEMLIATSDIPRSSNHKIFIIDSCTGKIKNTISPQKHILRFAKYQNLFVILMLKSNIYYLQVLTTEGKSLFYTNDLKDMLKTGDTDSVIRLKAYKTLIAINRRDGPLYIIDFEKDTTTYTSPNVCSVCFGDEIIAVGKTNGTIQILDMNYKNLRRYNHGVRARINKIKIYQDYMISLVENMHCAVNSHNGYVWNLRNHVLLYIIKGISIFEEDYTCSMYQDKFIYIKDACYPRKRRLAVVDLSTGNQIFDISISSENIGTSSSNGHYIFVSTSTTDYIGTAYIHCSQSGKENTSISDFLFCTTRIYSIRSTETKLAYITDNGDLVIRNYEKFIH